MQNLKFDYLMEINYSIDVSICYYTIKCIPQDTLRQKISNLKIELCPDSNPQWAYDSLNNRYIFGCNGEPHDYFKFRITGEAASGLSEYESIASENDKMIFRHPHGLNVSGDSLKNYYSTLVEKYDLENIESPLQKAKLIMNQLYNDFSYEQNVTSVTTTAEEAFSLGKGVCQDYSHILISLLHLSGCSARYVTGLLIGEGKSHAWVEVIDDGKWYGIDPTNNTMVNDSHIKIGVGRDANDCQINRGIMHGGGNQTQKVNVVVDKIGAESHFMKKGAL